MWLKRAAVAGVERGNELIVNCNGNEQRRFVIAGRFCNRGGADSTAAAAVSDQPKVILPR